MERIIRHLQANPVAHSLLTLLADLLDGPEEEARRLLRPARRSKRGGLYTATSAFYYVFRRRHDDALRTLCRRGAAKWGPASFPPGRKPRQNEWQTWVPESLAPLDAPRNRASRRRLENSPSRRHSQPEAPTNNVWLETAEDAFTHALACHGVVKPRSTAQSVFASITRQQNPTLAWADAQTEVAPSTLWERVKNANWRGIIHEVRAELVKHAARLFERRPPDEGDVVLGMDVRQWEHCMKPGVHRCRPRTCRSNWNSAATAKNKNASHAQHWLLVYLDWHHKGQRITALIHMQLLGKELRDHSPAYHVDQAARAAKAVGVQTRKHNLLLDLWLTGDRAYDANQARQRARQYGLKMVHRVRRGHRWVRVGDTRLTLDQLIERTANTRALKLRVRHNPRVHDKKKMKVLYRMATYRATFEGDTEAVDLVVMADLEVVRDPIVRPILDAKADHCVLGAPAGTGGDLGRRIYARRWPSTETQFNQLAQDAPAWRPKTITSHVLQVVAFLLVRALTAWKYVRDKFLQLIRRPKHRRDRFLSTRKLSRQILDRNFVDPYFDTG